MGACAPHSCAPHFFKSEKSALFGGQSAPFTERKKYFLNERPLLLEKKCPFRSSKDSVKTISEVIETPNFRLACERHKIV